VSANVSVSGTNYLDFTAGGAGAIGTGAFTIVVLFRATSGNNNCGLTQGRTSGASVRSFLMDSLKLFGEGDFSDGYPSGNLSLDTWYVAAIRKQSGSVHYRFTYWPYASDGSGTMNHGESTSSGNHSDGSTVTVLRIGNAGNPGNGDFAAVGYYTSHLSDANLDTLKSNLLSKWADLSPAELISFEDWNGTNGHVVNVGTSTLSSITGTVGAGAANPPSFDFSTSSAINLVVQDAAQAQTVDNIALTQVHSLVVADARQLQTVDNLALTQVHSLVVQDATQAQAVDNLALTQVHNLIVADALQNQLVDNINLNQVHSLIVADALQSQAADNLVLAVGGIDLIVSDAHQSQTADTLILTQLHNLVVHDARQLQFVDNITFAEDETVLAGAITAAGPQSGAVTYAVAGLAGTIE
jgi:hypothetical protein